jgi:ubiquinol-cytochrome c reductase cytochrome b subunit
LILSVVIFYLLPFLSQNKTSFLKTDFILCWVFLFVFLILTWIGGKPVEDPYILIGQIFTMCYFTLVFLFCL